ncbi:MAG TPA: hypothetical protein PLN33_17310 [Hyphomonadaceae bacterium]|nr:hypothetical protein [Hyphomonadaceae bacterium]HPN05134.1 hypothetical protein [Hyphomonadaceae bacterium]
MNDAVILLCGVILLLAVLPMILMGRAFKGAGSRKDAAATDVSPVGTEQAATKAKTGHGSEDSGGFSESGGGDGGGDGE